MIMIKPAADISLPFQIEGGNLRGRIVRLGPALDEILGKHDYPPPVARLLAEMAATGAALAAMLKYAGKFSLQARGDGPVRLVVADMTHDGGLRAYAQYDANGVAQMGDEGIGLLGKGYLAFTVEPPADIKQESYQGIVELRGKDIAAAAQYYFRESEQIPTGIVTASSRDSDGHWHAGCLILQHMPDEGGTGGLDLSIGDPPPASRDTSTANDWQRAMMLMSTCTPLELTDPDIAPETLLYRLFHEEGVRAFAPRALRHVCACATRITDTLRLFSRDEVASMAENGVVTMNCQFCGAQYRYTAAEIEQIFAVPSA